MLKQPDDEETGVANGEDGKANLETEPASSPSSASHKRDANERYTGAERKRVRTDAAHERGDELSKGSAFGSGGGGERQSVDVAQDDRSGDVVKTGGADSAGEASVEPKLVSSAAAEKGVQAKSRRNAVVTALTAVVAEDRGSRLAMEDAWVILPQAWLGDPGKLR